MDYEVAQQWEKAAQEFTLAVAADPSNMEYQLHFRRAAFNASQAFMQQGRALPNSATLLEPITPFGRLTDTMPVNELAVSEMERMLRFRALSTTRQCPVRITGPRVNQAKGRHAAEWSSN